MSLLTYLDGNRKTGWMPKDNVRKDELGMDNIEDFFASSSEPEPERNDDRNSLLSL